MKSNNHYFYYGMTLMTNVLMFDLEIAVATYLAFSICHPLYPDFYMHFPYLIFTFTLWLCLYEYPYFLDEKILAEKNWIFGPSG